MVPRLAVLSLTSLLACGRSDETPDASTKALEAATAELAAARTAWEAERTALGNEITALRKAVDDTNAKLALLAAERVRPAPTREPTGALVPGVPPFSRAEGPSPLDPATVEAAVRCESETRCTIDAAFIETLVINPGSLASQARIVPSMRDEAIVGFKLYGIRAGSLPKALGLKNGDLLRSINGHDLTSVEQALEAYAKLRSEKTFTLALERRAVPLTLTVEVVGRP